MSGEDRDVYRALAEAGRAGRTCALATVVATRGSTPRKTGAKMMVDPDVGLVGTVGGGCGEARVIEAAGEVVAAGRPRMVQVDLTDDPLSWTGSVCGGVLDVFVEPVFANLVHIRYLRPPDREEIFTQELLLDRTDAKVTLARGVHFDPPLRILERIALEEGSHALWFTFPDLWHDIGRFYRADGTLSGIYANILTPPRFPEENVWETKDLFLDVWLPAGNAEEGLHVLDEDQLEEALARGWVTEEEAERARGEVRTIRSAYDEGTWPPPLVEEWTLERALAHATPSPFPEP